MTIVRKKGSCRHCAKPRPNRPRGLCSYCFARLEIRDLYPRASTPPKTHKLWYPSDERELARLRLEGLSRPEIARRMGRTTDSIKGQIMKYPSRYPKRTRRDCWYDALQVVHTIEGAAEAMGVKPCAVHKAKLVLRRKGCSVGPAKRKGVGA